MEQPFNFAVPEVQWYAIMPLAIVAITGMFALLAQILRPRKDNDLLILLSLGGLAFAGFVLSTQLSIVPEPAVAGALYRDTLGTALQLAILISTALCVLFSDPYLKAKGIAHGEFYPLVLWASVGAMLMVSTKHLLVVFVGLEILSVALYVLAGMSRREEKSEESAMKYFLLGAFASAFLLFGIAFIYGGTGTLNLDEAGLVYTGTKGEARMLIGFGLALLLVGLGFKASFVPFHQWTPDVYQGAPTNVSAFMATTAKIGALGAIFRILLDANVLRELWLPPLTVIAGLTMIVGSVLALTQKDVKRILAYSSITNAGYLLVAILAGTSDRTDHSGAALTYYLIGYSVLTIGAFAAISIGARAGAETTRLEDLRGMWQRSPLAALVLVVSMVSLIGIPPTAGFFGKLLIVEDAIRAGLVPLAIILAVSSAISLYYYLQIAGAALSATDDTAMDRLDKPSRLLNGTLVTCLAVTALLTVMFGPIMRAISNEEVPAHPNQQSIAPGGRAPTPN